MDILIDFDGTCVSHEFPKVGNSIGSVSVLKELVDKGHNLILFTMRCDHPSDFKLDVKDGAIEAKKGNYLTDAINWFKENNIPLYGIQTNPTQHNWTTSPKAYGKLMIDDSALGCPMRFDEKISKKPFVDWHAVRQYLKITQLI